MLTLNNVAEVVQLPDVTLIVAGREGVVGRRLRLTLHSVCDQREGPFIVRRYHTLWPEHLRWKLDKSSELGSYRPYIAARVNERALCL